MQRFSRDKTNCNDCFVFEKIAFFVAGDNTNCEFRKYIMYFERCPQVVLTSYLAIMDYGAFIRKTTKSESILYTSPKPKISGHTL